MKPFHGAFEALERPANEPRTLVAALAAAAQTTRGILYLDRAGHEEFQSYRSLLEEARARWAGLASLGLERGSVACLVLDQPRDFLTAFWACAVGGLLPSPLESPARGTSDLAWPRVRAACRAANPALILTTGQYRPILEDLGLRANGRAIQVVQWDDVPRSVPIEPPNPEPADPALLLWTSGSTGVPKGVVLSHDNILSMAAGTRQRKGLTAGEVTLNWLGLSHVGAIAFLHLLPVALGCQQIHAPTESVLRDIFLWLDWITKYQVSITWAPNFAFRLLLDRAKELSDGRWDLASLRMLVNAGELVVPTTAARVVEMLARHGLPNRALVPAFGMSETASGITWSNGFDAEREENAPEVDLGPPIPGARLRIVDAEGNVLPEGTTGRLEVAGPSVMLGYYPLGSAARGEWFATGDLGYLRNGHLFIAGREKDTLNIRGMQMAPGPLEEAIAAIPGIESAALVGVRDANSDTERLAIFFAARSDANETLLVPEVRRCVVERLGQAPEFVVPLDPRDLPRTAIGKVDRARLRRDFELGAFSGVLVHDVAGRTDHNFLGQREERLAHEWREVLGLSNVGAQDNFFDLGGTSVQLAQLAERLEESLGRSISPTLLLTYPTIRSLAEFLEGKATPFAAPATKATPDSPRSGAVAIIGMACRFPGAADLGEFWSNLRGGVESIRFWKDSEVADRNRRGDDSNGVYIPASGWLEGIDQWDAEFFGTNADEARRLDPQHRLFLEMAWHALEDAGIDPRREHGKIGIFATAGPNLYARRFGLEPDLAGDFEAALARSAPDFLSMRASYALGLRGPSLTVQTACSSGLVALHLARQSLLRGDCAVAIVGAASLWFLEPGGYVAREGGLASSDGHCRAFDAGGTGMVFGNGVGVLVLKPLEMAQRDGDYIRAVVTGSAVNNDGAAKAGFLATGVWGQAQVIADALADAGHSADAISYVECHGTGTVLGDAIELTALDKALGQRLTDEIGVAIGSVKSNVGHLGVACGIAGLIKTILMVEHAEIVPSLHFHTLNPQFDWSRARAYVADKLQPWRNEPRRAGVSAFGLGGTNAHVIVEQAPSRPQSVRPPGPYRLVLSARSPSALEAMRDRLADYLERHPEVSLADVAHTLGVGRTRFAHTTAFEARDLADAIRQLRSGADLESAAATETTNELHAGDPPVLGDRLPLPGYPFERKRYWLDDPRQPGAAAAPTPPAIHQEQASSARGRRSEWERLLGQWACELASLPGGLDSRAMRKGFLDLGLTSVQAVELARRAAERAGRALPATILFEYPTITDLAAYLAED